MLQIEFDLNNKFSIYKFFSQIYKWSQILDGTLALGIERRGNELPGRNEWAKVIEELGYEVWAWQKSKKKVEITIPNWAADLL